MRAEENRGGRSPRCTGYAIAGRFLATEEHWRNCIACGGVSDRIAQRTSSCPRLSIRPENATPRVELPSASRAAARGVFLEIESLREQIEKLQATLEQQRQAYEDYVVNLTVKEEKE